MHPTQAEGVSRRRSWPGGDTDPVSYRRFVAVGDSFTEGVGDPAPTRPNGVRGWADRVAEVLAAEDPAFAYANLAIRGRKLMPILREQIQPAIELQPDLIAICAGINDLIRVRTTADLDTLGAAYDEAIGRLAATGARVLVWTTVDPGSSVTHRLLRGRFAIYNEIVRESADRHGATVVDFWRMREYGDWRLWDTDRMHMSPTGHQRMAAAVLNTLDVPHDLPETDDPQTGPLGRREALRTHADWVRVGVYPWIRNSLARVSTGDGLSARHPQFDRPHDLDARLDGVG